MINRFKGVLIHACAVLVCMTPAIGKASSPVPAFVVTVHTDDDDKKRPASALDEYIIPGKVIVKFKEQARVTVSASKTGLSAVDRMTERFAVKSMQKALPALDRLSASKKASFKGMESLERVYMMEIDESRDPMSVANAFSGLAEVEYAEPMYMHKITAHRTTPAWFESAPAILATPNDVRIESQSHLELIQALEAWDIVKGEQGNVLIAVLDGGTDWRHEDIQANVFTNPGEIPGNGVDDDNNDFIDDVNGWNFPDNDGDPRGQLATPINASHGTETAGVVAAVTDNNTGIAGLAWNAEVLPVNISCATTDNALCFSISGVFYGAIMGADVINASFGGPGRSAFFQDVIDFAYDNGSLVVAAAGNEGVNSDITPSYPANYNHVMAVCWTGKTFDSINASSNFGISVDVCAPGSSIDATAPNNDYVLSSGTSFSSPIAAGVAALVKTQSPNLTVDELREQVRATSDDISSRNSTVRFRGKIGKGRVNAFRALTEQPPSVRIVNATIADARGSSRVGPGEAATVTVDLINYLEPVSNLGLTLESSSRNVDITQSSSTVASLSKNQQTTASFSFIADPDVPFNESVNLVLRMDDGSAYQDVDVVPIVVNSTNHDTGTIEVTLTEEGNIGFEGFAEESQGNGFRFLGVNYLFEGGLIMGNGVGNISDNVRGLVEQEDDFERTEGSIFGIDDGRVTSEEGTITLADSKGTSPLNITVRQDSYADTSAAYQDFVVLRYIIENTGSSAIANFHTGLFFDWDSETFATDYALYDAERRMGIYQDGSTENASVFIGTRILSDGATPHYRAIDNDIDLFDDDRFSDSDKWNFISGGVGGASQVEKDISQVIAAGPYALGVGQTIEVAFAMVAGSTLEELNTNADVAQQLWDQQISTLGPNPVSNEDPVAQPLFSFSLGEPYPNPASGQATIEYEIPSSGSVALSIYDMLGREVRTLVSETLQAGKHSMDWDGRDNAGRTVASGVYLVSLASPSETGLKTATKKIVMVR